MGLFSLCCCTQPEHLAGPILSAVVSLSKDRLRRSRIEGRSGVPVLSPVEGSKGEAAHRRMECSSVRTANRTPGRLRHSENMLPLTPFDNMAHFPYSKCRRHTLTLLVVGGRSSSVAVFSSWPAWRCVSAESA